MLLLQALPTSIGVAAIAPALLVLWLVIAADERPGPPARVWLAFLLGAASISLLGIARAPFAAILAVPGNPWMTQGLRSVFGVAAPEEIVKVLVIVAVSMRRRTFADPMDTVVYGAAAGLGFAAYENLAYLVQHADMWRSLAALRSVLDRAVSRRARHHRGRLYRHRTRRNGAGRQSASPGLVTHLKLGAGVVCAGRVACRVRFSVADAAEASRPRVQRPECCSERQAC